MRAVRRACRVAGVVGDGKIGLVITPISDRARSVLLFFYGSEGSLSLSLALSLHGWHPSKLPLSFSGSSIMIVRQYYAGGIKCTHSTTQYRRRRHGQYRRTANALSSPARTRRPGGTVSPGAYRSLCTPSSRLSLSRPDSRSPSGSPEGEPDQSLRV
jgi:hypothetical protein